jgi:hypothetical protein
VIHAPYPHHQYDLKAFEMLRAARGRGEGSGENAFIVAVLKAQAAGPDETGSQGERKNRR